eukprot:TRINITY_DN825_c0_g1_i1.p1 TRINITY_DN825_c0_g1~~TRINITY_DN825_c0_g1_i1.p1  ORF type:complete len:128 (+),score=25.24 TRINITY_DN825_c0_g1_i1:387-770(+)
MKEQMTLFSDPSNVDKVKRLQREIDEVKDLLGENLRKMVERGRTIDDIDNDVAELENFSKQFDQNAKELESTMWWRNIRMRIMIGVIILVIIFIIITIICGGLTYYKCRSESEPSPSPDPEEPTQTG